ncbi:MAG: dienelactone hydrolase family protein [Gammaproteobacteria bacterium]
MPEKQKIQYQDGDVELEGYCAVDKSKPGQKPAVLVFHDWSGRNEFAQKKAEQLAELGYIGFAVDMYGSGKVGTTTEEKQELMKPLANNRVLLRQRVLAALEAVKKQPDVDLQRIGAIGFCFGGLCALDLARSGADVRGVVSFHGLLHKPENLPDKKIVAKVLAMHGHDDPMVKPDQVLAFETEMTEQKVDWQVHVYGGTQHGFTNPLAKDNKLGIFYNEVAARRSWIAMKNFFEEVLG